MCHQVTVIFPFSLFTKSWFNSLHHFFFFFLQKQLYDYGAWDYMVHIWQRLYSRTLKIFPLIHATELFRHMFQQEHVHKLDMGKMKVLRLHKYPHLVHFHMRISLCLKKEKFFVCMLMDNDSLFKGIINLINQYKWCERKKKITS